MSEPAIKAIVAILVYGVATGILNLLIAERSRIDSWAERKPRLAAWLKLMRSVGFDPWMLVASVQLAVSKKLPAAQRAGSMSIGAEQPPAPNKLVKLD
jgi:hypothetical protein